MGGLGDGAGGEGGGQYDLIFLCVFRTAMTCLKWIVRTV